MRNIWNTQKKRYGYVELVITILVFFAVLAWFNIGFNSIVSTTNQEQLKEAGETIRKAVVLCYSIEGAYPPDIDYLKENYGINIDEKRYVIHYSAYASNLMPEIVVFPRQ
ncbi:MAG: hypothetical protein WC900_01580 [Oscillospiraceae bacterium]|jgi:hypothetical protein